MIYLIYDISMRYVLTFRTGNIDMDTFIVVNRGGEVFEKWRCKGFGVITDLDTGDTIVVNLEDVREIYR